jgi:lipid-A-disaccharide synthase
VSLQKLRVGIVAGEASGDILGAALCRELRRRDLVFEIVGVGGPLMQAEGCRSLYDMDRLSVMGLIEPLKRLPELLAMRRGLFRQLLGAEIDVFIGVDSPDFNLRLEYRLKCAGVAVAHLVSPSVWAWRSRRIHKIARSVDLMMTLFPFETEIYERHQIAVTCIGHPLADQFPMIPDQLAARQQLGIQQEQRVVGLFPGSRAGEVSQLGQLFVDAAKLIHEQWPDLIFVVPAANRSRLLQLEQIIENCSDLPIRLILQQSHQVMTASDCLLMASGTATLEAMLLKKPMVVAYRMGRLSYAIISRMLHTAHIALPNLLAGERLVPEFVQNDATAEALAAAISAELSDSRRSVELRSKFDSIHRQLRKNAGVAAVDAILEMIYAKAGVVHGPV